MTVRRPTTHQIHCIRDLQMAGRDAVRIAACTGIPLNIVDAEINRNGGDMAWTKAQDKILLEMREKGTNWEDIAPHVGKSRRACSRRYEGITGHYENRVSSNGPPAPRPDAGIDRAIARIDRLVRAGSSRSDAIAQVRREMPHVQLREASHA